MKWRLEIRSAARDDLRKIADWYDGREPGLGDRFFGAMTAGLHRIEDGPEQFPIYYRDLHRLLVKGFPYKVFFRVPRTKSSSFEFSTRPAITAGS